MIENAIEDIEARLTHEDLNVPSVCEKAGVSRWYFQRIFKGVTGDSIGDYIRKRRLSLAALALTGSERPVLEIAIEHGFESQEAFTRAFKSHFGSTPAQFRKSRDPKLFMHKFQMDAAFLKHLEEKLIVTPKIETQPEMKLIGFSAPFRGIFDENPNNFEVIPPLWANLFKRLGDIQGKVEGPMYGVIDCKDMDGGEELDYMACVEVESFDKVPEGMSTYTFPEGRLAKFTHKGDMKGIDRTIKYALGTWLPQSKEKLREGLELEIYPRDYNPSNPESAMEHCLALI